MEAIKLLLEQNTIYRYNTSETGWR